jgi:formylglycine-generating enzyme required for sulfatase activity
MTNLVGLNLESNPLTNIVFPSDLGHLETILLGGNQLTSFTVPDGLTNLTGLFLTGNLLTNLTLPPYLTQLTDVGFLGNPLTTFVVSETLATNLTDTIASMQSQGVSVFTYPLTVQLARPRPLIGAFQFGILGPPGVYTILQSTDLTNWSMLSAITNNLGSISFVDTTAQLSPTRKFYRALQQSPPTNMVFIAPNTFVMGSPVTELHRQTNEGPQTTVTLTRGFWIGKFEVTQGEYLSVMGTNPSFFPGDLSRPISSVSWPDATNYCWILTQRELAAGRISAGSQYRLPTEAEWECAARAGTSTRFSYGDDPNYTSLTNYAWYFLNGGLTVHPVGQKLPNPWGLYDMEGNVWEWCQDWLGDLPGGTVSDPQGPPSNALGVKVVRGSAYDFSETDCRSARRFSFGAHPALTDTDLGFRVVLATGP